MKKLLAVLAISIISLYLYNAENANFEAKFNNYA
jgi:hypothetical protein